MASRNRRSTTTLVVSVVVALLFLGFVILLTGSTTISRATENARTLHWVNATNGSVSAVRASLSQAVLFAHAADHGFSDVEAADAAFSEATVSLGRAEQWVGAMADSGVENAGLQQRLTEFLAGSRMVLTALDEGGPETADQLFAEHVESEWLPLEAELIGRQQALADEIGKAEGLSGIVSALSKIALMVLVPVAAIFIYRWQARREQRDTRMQLEADLAAEQDLGRMKSQFIAGVSHELRTPLTSVVGFSHLLMKGGIDSKTARELVHGINGEAEELSRMVEDLLVASRPDGTEVPVHLEDCSVPELVEAVVGPQRRLGRTIHIRVEPGEMHGDPVRIRQIARNLVSNAFRHGGPTVWVTGGVRGADYLLVVADDGRGVGPGVTGRLFEPFVHTGETAVVSGSIGLGLSVARQLARQLGGDLTYQRTDGWTQFLLRLPAGSTPAPDPPLREDLFQAAL
ncbi:MAG: HAMP domain-containing histidine kinase [Actinobacteria bacterium]|nr:HAMP domain-containing histidine kinase [Actinomycetota bacterium]